MPKAEVGSTKWLSNKMKAKGLQRLRWYCQVCERQMRDANGFKQHTLSEGHVRQMQIVGQNANKFINDYSNQFKNDFVQLLRTSHGEKKININHFYQEYIANKEHVHMNATKWPSLTEFAKFLGREGICRIEEGERGLEVSWIDNSPEALRRQAAIRKRDRQDKGDEEREHQLIDEQVQRAKLAAVTKEEKTGQHNENPGYELSRITDERITLNLTTAKAEEQEQVVPDASENNIQAASNQTRAPPVKLSFGPSIKPRNVFSTAMKKKKKATGAGSVQHELVSKPMSEAERIMRDELDKKRRREEQMATRPESKRIRR